MGNPDKFNLLMLDQPDESVIKTYHNNFNVLSDTFNDMEQVEVIYTHLGQINFKMFPYLKFILCPVTNINHLGKIPKGVQAFNLDDREWLYIYAKSTAEWNVWAMLSLMRANKDELYGKTVGFIGYGRVAQQVASMIEGFGCSVWFYDKVTEPEFYKGPSLYVDMPTLLNGADVISVQLSETPVTQGFVGRSEFNKINNRKGKRPYFLNSSRSSIVSPKALLDSICMNMFSGIALDVMDDYEPEEKADLYSERQRLGNNFIITPHIAGQSKQARAQTDIYVLNKLLNRPILDDKEVVYYKYSCGSCGRDIVTTEHLELLNYYLLCENCKRYEESQEYKKWEGFK